MRTLRQDVLYALRQMRLSPIFTLTAMLTLALGIGATTAIFSVMDALMFRPLPIRDPQQLVAVGRSMGGFFSYKTWELIRDQQDGIRPRQAVETLRLLELG